MFKKVSKAQLEEEPNEDDDMEGYEEEEEAAVIKQAVTTPNKPIQKAPAPKEEKKEQEITYDDVLVNHEQRLLKIEAALFRIKESL